MEKPPVLWIVAGQSNAVGSCRPPYESAAYCGQFWYWYNGAGELRPLKDPTCGVSANAQLQGSAWPAFARQFFELTGRKVAILNVACGGSAVTNISSNTWYGSDDSNPLRITAATQYAAMTTSLGTVSEDYVLGGMLWIQGEAECTQVGTGTLSVSDYVNGTLDVFRFFRELTDDNDMQIYMSQIGYTRAVKTDSVTRLGYQRVQDAQTSICKQNENIHMAFEGAKYFLDASLMYDDIHYSQHGYNILGKAFARCVAKTQNF